jgi:hypothetical protein
MKRKKPRPAKPEGIPSAPRVKPRKTPKAGAPQGLAAPTRIETNRLSKGIRDDVKIAIADAILAFSEMEVAAEAFIWTLTGLNVDDGRILTRLDASQKFEIAKIFSERYGVLAPAQPAGKITMWNAMRDLAEARNKIAHGLWGTLDLTTPICMSLRFKSDLGQVVSESFGIPRLEAITRQSNQIKMILEGMTALASTSRAKRRPRHRKQKPTPPKRPARSPR